MLLAAIEYIECYQQTENAIFLLFHSKTNIKKTRKTYFTFLSTLLL